MLLTSKDGKFELKWFKLTFIEKDNFKMTYSPISIDVPTIDNVIHYSSNYDIEYTRDPIQRTNNINAVSEQQEKEEIIKTPIVNEVKEECTTEIKGVKKLARIFKKKN